jgi:hypothetical protein
MSAKNAMPTCPLCTARRRLDSHAPGLEENFPDLRFGVCQRCHNGSGGLTSRQYDTGILREHTRGSDERDPRTQAEQIHALYRGAVDLIGALGEPTAEGAIDESSLWELLGTAGTRLMHLTTDGPPIGPEPAKNWRRWQRSNDTSVRRPASDPDAWPDQVGPVLRFVADWSRVAAEVIQTEAPGSPLDESQTRLARDLDVALGRTASIVEGFAVLEDKEPLADLVTAVELCSQALATSATAIATMPTIDTPFDSDVTAAHETLARAELAFVDLLFDLGEGDGAVAFRVLRQTIEGAA